MEGGKLLPVQRRSRILKELSERGAVHISSLCRQLGVSPMTLHRDLDELVNQGYARKVRGGAIAAGSWYPRPGTSPAFPAAPFSDRCGGCAKPIDGRHTFTVQHDTGPLSACCAHCGLLLLGDGAQAAMALDFLFGHSLNALTAFYVVGPELVVCCSPAVLPFGRLQDAERFRQGFGGDIMSLEAARARVRAEMALQGTTGAMGCHAGAV